jgi:hypothetical protein
LATFANTHPTFKISHLGVSKFGFLSFCPFRIENHNAMPILLLTLKLKPLYFENGVVLESGKNGQSKRKSKFDTPK